MRISWRQALAATAITLAIAGGAQGDDRTVIDANTERALSWLRAADDGNYAALMDRAAGVLVFPDMVKMGFGVGGEFGAGKLLVKGEAIDYYVTAGKDYGMGTDAEYKAEVIFFMTQEALDSFRNQPAFQVGQHAQVPVVANASDALNSTDSHVGLIFSEDGAVSHLHMNGARITRIDR